MASGAENQSGTREAEFALAALESTSTAKKILGEGFLTRIDFVFTRQRSKGDEVDYK